MTATLAASVASIASATVRSAEDHEVATSSSPSGSASLSPPPRTSGSVRRASLWKASNAKRSLSASQPQLTASESMPWKRSTWSRDDWMLIRSPMAFGYVESTSTRSHGRALKRYGFAVSAPTGQIWTTLPLK